MTPRTLEVQGHRGARGLKPENTLVAFETAFDLGVTSIETDLNLSRDDVPIVFHDGSIFPPGCKVILIPGRPIPAAAELDVAPTPFRRVLARLTGRRPFDMTGAAAIRELTVGELRSYRAVPDRLLYPRVDAVLTPLARRFAEREGMDPFGLPTLATFFAFVEAYIGEPGRQAGKTPAQQDRGRRIRLDLEIKYFPRHDPQGDDFDPPAGLFERTVVDAIHQAGMVERVRVRSFNHRCVKEVKRLDPRIETAVLIAETVPVDPAALAVAADADVYCPDYMLTDPLTVEQVHRTGRRVIPWTANREDEWKRLVAWGVDGITTDYPDRLIEWAAENGIAVL